jgi:tetratricopeptide (TPR) repeat protein
VNGNCYDRIDVADPGISWEAAKTAAESLSFKGFSGHLATVTSQEENDFIVNNLGGSEVVRSHWLGGFQPPGSQESDGGWQWITGESFVFTNWASAEPSNSGGNEDAIGFHGLPLSGQWNDGSKDIEDLGYIVEYPDASVNIKELLESIETLWSQLKDLDEQVEDLQEDLKKLEDLDEQVKNLQEDLKKLEDLDEQVKDLQEDLKKLEDLPEQVKDLQVDLKNHRHTYLTGMGIEHNNTEAETGSATFSVAP